MKRLFIIAGLAGVILEFAASGAFAHAHPEHTSPGDGASLSESPTQVRIDFDAPLEPAFSQLKVKNAQGDVVSHDSRVADHDKRLEAKLPTLKPGTYQVHWSVTARDTHHTAGDYSFTVEP